MFEKDYGYVDGLNGHITPGGGGGSREGWKDAPFKKTEI